MSGGLFRSNDGVCFFVYLLCLWCIFGVGLILCFKLFCLLFSAFLEFVDCWF